MKVYCVCIAKAIDQQINSILMLGGFATLSVTP